MMSDENGGSYVPATVWSRQGVSAVGGLAGGAALFILGALPWFISVPLGAVATVVGVSALRSRDKADRLPGMILSGAGILTMVSRLPPLRFLQPLAGTLLGIGAAGLLALGVWNGIKFIKGLRNRS
jgi:hypothetical protein